MPQDGYKILKGTNDTAKRFKSSLWCDFRNSLIAYEKDHFCEGYPKKTFSSLIDVFGWVLVFCGFNKDIKNKELNCLEVYFRNKKNLKIDTKNIKTNISLLSVFFNFDAELFYSIFMYQGGIDHLLTLIVKRDFFTNNKFAKNTNKNKRIANLYPDQNLKLELPFLDIVCNGINFPVCVFKNGSLAVKKIDIDGFGDGHFVVCDGEVVDCLRVNDFWLINEPLSLRKKFLYRSKKEEKESLVCWNFQDMENAARILETNRSKGLIVRELGSNYLDGRWFVWNRKSIFAGNTTQSGRFTKYDYGNPVSFFSLDGACLGNRGVSQSEIKKFIFFDDIDLMNFKRILKIDK